jgi:hypothetical protein
MKSLTLTSVGLVVRLASFAGPQPAEL